MYQFFIKKTRGSQSWRLLKLTDEQPRKRNFSTQQFQTGGTPARLLNDGLEGLLSAIETVKRLQTVKTTYFGPTCSSMSLVLKLVIHQLFGPFNIQLRGPIRSFVLFYFLFFGEINKILCTWFYKFGYKPKY